MKTAAIITNAILLAVLLWMSVEHGMPSPSDKEFLLFIAMWLSPAFNLLALYSKGDGWQPAPIKWLALWLERKILEEERRVKALRG